MENLKPNKKNRLTLYIVIALVIGIALGFVLNKSLFFQLITIHFNQL